MSTEQPTRHHSAKEIKEFYEQFRRKPRWWQEVIYIAIFYGLYSAVRNVHGSLLSVTTAHQHAYDIVHLEKTLHIFNEERIQAWFLPHEWFIRFLNIYYGTAHFIVTIGVLLWLFFRNTQRYHQWRNIIFATTGLALVGYMTYPLAPPRFLSEYHFVDTLITVGGAWSIDSDTVKNVSNLYAAMPSLHVGWSLWCACALMTKWKKWWQKILLLLYPSLTILTIIVTGNHYWADVAGGMLIFGIGYLVGSWSEARWKRKISASTIDAA